MRQPAVLAVLAACNLAVAFGFQWLPVMALGVGASTDAFFVSNLVPQLVLAVIGANLTSVLTPQLSTHEGVRFATTAWTFAYGLAAAAVLVNGLLWVAAPLWVSWVAPGFDESTLALTLDLVRIQLVGFGMHDAADGDVGGCVRAAPVRPRRDHRHPGRGLSDCLRHGC